MAISMIATTQHDACPAIKACAYALLETNNLDQFSEASSVFADTLTNENLNLSSTNILSAPALFDRPEMRLN